MSRDSRTPDADCSCSADRHANAAPIAIEVWKSTTCGCCKGWIAHLQANGFRGTVRAELYDINATIAVNLQMMSFL